MTEVRIDTARGIRLAGTLTLPEGAAPLDVETLQERVSHGAAGWLAGLGYARLGVHANGLGATATLLARPESVRTAVLVGAIVGPQSILWEHVFSPDQLDQLDRHGLTRLVDDNPNPRRWNVLSKQTLADVSLQSPETTMADLSWPVLMVHGALTDEFPDSEAGATEGFPMLPDGSRLVQIRTSADADESAEEQVARLGTEWFTRRLR